MIVRVDDLEMRRGLSGRFGLLDLAGIQGDEITLLKLAAAPAATRRGACADLAVAVLHACLLAFTGRRNDHSRLKLLRAVVANEAL